MSTENLISRKDLFSYPKHLMVKISPDGKYFSYLTPKNGVLNVNVAKVENFMQSCLGGKAEPLGSALTDHSAIIFEQEDMDLLGEADVNTATSTSEEL